ncbi:MAG: 30S ribosomal protein S17 [Spirochaetes bacterium GWD1_27_9]|nr:MAG: 30S ribosomal protein S17 [Spirochaetes bacterium GWB1_27_13]OHD21029.1 MAG: 30S ribosomal protein S17 [Spirochaetes bacterium GWC1_27_15]OHD45390.1 MAG: 30S ribosomal protein S17 [Spirochaetes bacterium GWD1_27_9]
MEKEKIIKTMNGTIVSDKMDKTVVVLVEYKVMHPLYKKYVKKSRKFKAHDENNQCKIGDFVKIELCNPISKYKKWAVKEIIRDVK